MRGMSVAFGLAALSTLPCCGAAMAAGFALREQSATAQGNAFAGATAGADDISYMFFNPAALGMMRNQREIVAAGSLVPSLAVDRASAACAGGSEAEAAADADP